MNVFALDDDPVKAARAQCNKHVVKMLCETAQMLCTVLRASGVSDDLLMYKSTHSSHPCTVWAASDSSNLTWLYEHGLALSREYTRRYEKVHASSAVIHSVSNLIVPGTAHLHTPFAQAMPEQYKRLDAVEAYRAYYVGEKSRFARWAPRSRPPEWWPWPNA